ncbi:MAG: response regulator transcription factor [Chloroflexota bacterium]
MPAIRVAILDDHQSIIDGYIYRLEAEEGIQVVASGRYGMDLEAILVAQPVDVLLLDLSLPTSPENRNLFPVLLELPRIVAAYPGLKVIVISVFNQPSLIKALNGMGVNGYIFKDDDNSIKLLAQVVKLVAAGGVYFSPGIQQELAAPPAETRLSPRQLEVLFLCMAYPDMGSSELARKLKISGSTFRNLLSGVYTRLGVRTRAAAIARARQLGIIPQNDNGPFDRQS